MAGAGVYISGAGSAKYRGCSNACPENPAEGAGSGVALRQADQEWRRRIDFNE